MINNFHKNLLIIRHEIIPQLSFEVCIYFISTALTIEEKCVHGATFIPHPTECQLYYDCSFTYDGPIPRFFEQHMKECDYPAYFNTETNTCDFDFENVDCGNRARHIDACKYLLIHFKIFLDCAFVRDKISRVGSLIIF